MRAKTTLLAGAATLLAAAASAQPIGEGLVMYMQMGGNPGDGATLARQTGAAQAAAAFGVDLKEQFSAWAPETMINQFKEAVAARPDCIEIMGHPGSAAFQDLVEDAVGQGIFEDTHDNMIMVRDIELYSLCEHHLLPFFGKAHIAYIPAGRILGLSKLPRIVDLFARRLQVQERLTSEIADAIQAAVQPLGVGVVIEAYHLCMMMRGVQKQNSMTITSALLGSFRNDAKTRDEFLRLAHARSPLRD